MDGPVVFAARINQAVIVTVRGALDTGAVNEQRD